jgi:pyridinium-3,5-biscarboxylic acid mononucleotide sulfurtransferase
MPIDLNRTEAPNGTEDLTGPERTAAEQKLIRLQDLLRSWDRVLIAFSGGVDSTFLAKVAQDTLGERALAVTVRSETFPKREQERAYALARLHGFHFRVLDRSELSLPDFVRNPPDRCYYCKQDLFRQLRAFASAEGIPYVLDGTSATDVHDHRPGRRAGEEHGIRSPLLETDLTRAEIRWLSRRLGLETWDQPSAACLASRIPYGEPITREKLRQVETAEAILHELGVAQCRVRLHGPLARIEVWPAEAFGRVMSTRESLTARFKELGFTYVALDLTGYRTGSLNAVLESSTGGNHAA